MTLGTRLSDVTGRIEYIIRCAIAVQVYDQASLPSVRPSQQDNRAYRLTLSSRGLGVLKLANVIMDPIIATQGTHLGNQMPTLTA